MITNRLYKKCLEHSMNLINNTFDCYYCIVTSFSAILDLSLQYISFPWNFPYEISYWICPLSTQHLDFYFYFTFPCSFSLCLSLIFNLKISVEYIIHLRHCTGFSLNFSVLLLSSFCKVSIANSSVPKVSTITSR